MYRMSQKRAGPCLNIFTKLILLDIKRNDFQQLKYILLKFLMHSYNCFSDTILSVFDAVPRLQFVVLLIGEASKQ